MRQLLLTTVILLSSSVSSLAGHPDPDTKPGALKPTLAVGVALDKKGSLWLAKIDNQRLVVSRSDDNGLSFSSPVVVTPEPENILADGENRPKIAIAQDGTVLLSWTQSLPQKLYASNVRFSRSTDSGQTFSPPVTLNDDGLITSHSFETLAISDAGNVAVAWLDGRDTHAAKERGEAFSGVSIYSVQSRDNGASFGKNKKFQQHICECCRISSTWGKEGPIAFWRNIFASSTRDFALSNLDKGGIRRATDDEWQVDACPHNGGDIAADDRGQLHLIWFTNGTTRQGLFYKRIDGEWESQPLPFGNPDSQANHASIAVDAKTLLLTWREFDGHSYSAQMMHSNDGGVTWSTPKNLMRSAGATDYPIPKLSGKKALVVWNTAADGLRILPIDRVVSASR